MINGDRVDESMWVSGDRERVFINTSIGCSAKCKYCYLPQMGIIEIEQITDIGSITSNIEKREKEGTFISGPQGTIVSLGCFTECWHKDVKKITRDIILFFLAKGNYIQIATKEYIEKEEIEYISKYLKYKNQLTVNVSLPTYNEARIIEPFAENVEKRVQNFKYNQKYGIDFVLYIKPIIENITIQNKDVYVNLINTYDLKVVVGKFLNVDKIENSTEQNVGGNKMWPINSIQHQYLVEELKKITEVYENSIEVILAYREKRG